MKWTEREKHNKKRVLYINTDRPTNTIVKKWRHHLHSIPNEYHEVLAAVLQMHSCSIASRKFDTFKTQGITILKEVFRMLINNGVTFKYRQAPVFSWLMVEYFKNPLDSDLQTCAAEIADFLQERPVIYAGFGVVDSHSNPPFMVYYSEVNNT